MHYNWKYENNKLKHIYTYIKNEQPTTVCMKLQSGQNKEPSIILTLSHMLSSVPDTNSTGMCSGSPLRSSLRCWWACVCPGGCRGKDRQMTPCTASSDSSLSCLAKAAAARHPIDLPAVRSERLLDMISYSVDAPFHIIVFFSNVALQLPILARIQKITLIYLLWVIFDAISIAVLFI